MNSYPSRDRKVILTIIITLSNANVSRTNLNYGSRVTVYKNGT